AGPLAYTATTIGAREAVFHHPTDVVREIVYRLEGPKGLLVRLVRYPKGKAVHQDFRFQRATRR
ncbi:MAG: hypothetical protein QF464_17760, partial [Myxococcota bacterium]|nr:hypothetical protein [Myxococcota bacterium]